MSASGNEHSNESAEFLKVYSSFVSPISLTNPNGMQTRACRWIKINAGSGTITLKDKNGITMDALPVGAGDIVDIKASEISSVSGITSVTVFW